MDEVFSIFGYNMEPRENGFKYLGFFMKPDRYRNLDWLWLVKRIDKKTSSWVYKFMSIGGRLTLVYVVLSNIPVYWFSIMMVPKSILKSIRSKVFNFLWRGVGKRSSFHFVAWEHLALPKRMGGWSIQNWNGLTVSFV